MGKKKKKNSNTTSSSALTSQVESQVNQGAPLSKTATKKGKSGGNDIKEKPASNSSMEVPSNETKQESIPIYAQLGESSSIISSTSYTKAKKTNGSSKKPNKPNKKGRLQAEDHSSRSSSGYMNNPLSTSTSVNIATDV